MEENKELDLNQEIMEIKKELNDIKNNNTNLANSKMLNKIIDDYLAIDTRIKNIENNNQYEVINNNVVEVDPPKKQSKFELN